MASFHLAVKAIGRSAGRSATAAAAYRAGVEITDERTGLVHDYTRKQGVEHSELMLPTDAPEWAADRERLWNAAEMAETRKNATVAREYEIALPVELSADERRELALGLAREISERHGVAVDVSIHAPGREGDQRNHHAHLLTTTRRLGPEGLGEKTRELDQKQSGEVERWRERWAEMQNRALELANVPDRVDHRSHQRQGIEQEPTVHMGPSATAMERRAEQVGRGGGGDGGAGRTKGGVELAKVPDRVDHRGHQRDGMEQGATGQMGPSGRAREGRAGQVAAREGRAYGPVTAVGQHNAGVVERAGLRQYIERGTEWLRDMGQRIAGRLHDVAASLSGAVERDRREAAEVQLAREAQERLAADRARQEAQERQQVRERERVAEKFNTIAGKREAGAHGSCGVRGGGARGNAQAERRGV